MLGYYKNPESIEIFQIYDCVAKSLNAREGPFQVRVFTFLPCVLQRLVGPGQPGYLGPEQDI